MKTETLTTETTITEQIINQVLSTWTSRNKAVSDFFDKYNESAYLNEVAPGRNRAAYLFGHLIATNDSLLPLLGIGEKLFPELEKFSAQPDKSFEITSSIKDLKKQWETVNTMLADHFNTMQPSHWLERHTAVSAEDFKKEPNRNKLAILLGRTNHQSYHLGQLNLLTVN